MRRARAGEVRGRCRKIHFGMAEDGGSAARGSFWYLRDLSPEEAEGEIARKYPAERYREPIQWPMSDSRNAM